MNPYLSPSRDAEAWPDWERSAPSGGVDRRPSSSGSSTVASSHTIDDDDDSYVATIYTKYRDMFYHIVREEFRHSLGGPSVDHSDREPDMDESQRNLKEETYLGMLRMELSSLTILEEPGVANDAQRMWEVDHKWCFVYFF